MRRALVLALAAGLGAAAGCGDTCSSRAADVSGFGSCSTGSAVVSIPVQLCASCSDSSPACRTEVVGSDIQLDASFQECQSNASCPPTPPSCSSVMCQVQLAPGTYTVSAQSGGGVTHPSYQVRVSAGGAVSCL